MSSTPNTPRRRLRPGRESFVPYRPPEAVKAWESCLKQCESIITSAMEDKGTFKLKRQNIGNVRFIYETKDSVLVARQLMKTLNETQNVHCAFNINPTGKDDFPEELEIVIFEQDVSTKRDKTTYTLLFLVFLLFLLVFSTIAEAIYRLYFV
jgi:hypothetical protein